MKKTSTISENELAKLSYANAPKMKTKKYPGPKAQNILKKTEKVESLLKGAGSFPLVFAEGKGVTVKDPDGNIFLDTSAGVGVNSVGRRHPRVLAAIRQHLDGDNLFHTLDGTFTKRTELGETISKLMPAGLKGNCITFFTQSGSGAVETAIKFAHQITGRSQILAFHGAYHGVWKGVNALTTGDLYRKGKGPFMPGAIHAPFPYCYRCCFGLERKNCDLQCAKYVDYLLNTPYTGADDVAAVIIESLQGEGGYIDLPPGYLEIVKKACQKHGALYIADEVQSGAGRSGKMWAIEYSSVQPDILTFGKGVGGDLPMAGVVVRSDLHKKLTEASQPNTFAANGLSAVVTMTNLEIITENNYALVKRVAKLGKQIKDRLQKEAEEIKIIGEVRGSGFMIGIELVKNKKTRQPLTQKAMGEIIFGLLTKGVILIPCGRNGNVLRLMPSLTITEKYFHKAVDILLQVINEKEEKRGRP